MGTDHTVNIGADSIEPGRQLLEVVIGKGYRLMEALAQGPLSRDDAATRNGTTAPSADQTLIALAAGGLAHKTRDGTRVYWRATADGARVMEVVAALAQFLTAHESLGVPEPLKQSKHAHYVVAVEAEPAIGDDIVAGLVKLARESGAWNAWGGEVVGEEFAHA